MTAGKAILKVLTTSATILIWVLVVFYLYRFGQFAYDMGYRVFTEPAMTTEAEAKDKLVTIDSDMSDLDIGKELEEKGLIDNHILFVIQYKLSAYSGKIKDGTYTLSTSMTTKDMLKVMAQSDEDSTESTEEE
ncbi:MAG: endolytic transglycosylase MltG [Lachnospiraceae bacterium]|nr:endolytic transglycosylase MltG [Lachnospiraceae bacterium]